jgi:hypothetical protein
VIKSYVAKTTINFIDFEFYVRPGDMLVHDTANHNRLTVYRNGQIVKIVKQEPLGIVAFIKNKFIEEVLTPVEDVVVIEVPNATLAPSEATSKPSKRDKAQGQEVPASEYYDKLKKLKTDTTESELVEK